MSSIQHADSAPSGTPPAGAVPHATPLRRAIEGEILPRLLALHASPPPAEVTGAPTLSARLSVELALDAVGSHPEKVAARLERLLEGGADPAELCLHLLAPAARHLGHLWVEDELDFVDVTLGTMRLERALRGLLPGARRVAGRAPSILMIPLPGNQHTFGLTMAADFFRRAGWTVSDAAGIAPVGGQDGASAARNGATPDGLAALERHLRSRALDAIGIAVSCETQTARLARALAMIRTSSANPRIRIVLGGPLFVVQPGLAASFDADLVVTDASRAPAQLAALLPDPDAGRGIAGAAAGRPA